MKTRTVWILLLFSVGLVIAGYRKDLHDQDKSDGIDLKASGFLRTARDVWKDIKCDIVNCPDPEHSPTITCDGPKHVTAPAKSFKAVVNWNSPHVSDQDNNARSPTRDGQAPGSAFGEGFHSVKYTVTDTSGLSASCTTDIFVNVIRCSQPGEVLHGTKTCTNTTGEILLGDVCSFSCKGGYTMDGSPNSKCQTNGQFGPINPVCKPVPCPHPPPIGNGTYDCKHSDYHFGGTCNLNCKSGYRAGKGKQYISCLANKTWSQSAICIEDNRPPNITCDPQPKEIIAPPGSTSAVVNYALPYAHDHEDGLITPVTSGPRPGSTFAEGVTYVKYTATDSNGITATCEKVISVEVIRCTEPADVLHGTKNCSGTKGMALLGSSCSFSCQKGYKLNGTSTIRCSEKKQFEPKNPKCEPLPCPPPPVISNATYDCKNTTYHYGDTCYLNCTDGYRPGKGNQYISCQADQTWSKSATCVDTTPPVFVNCPLNVTHMHFSDRGLNYTNVTWDTVTAIDNQGRPAKVTLVSPKPWGTYFEEGEHDVVYQATDESGNQADTPCSFKITVETIRCPTPNLYPNDTLQLMQYGCKEYIYGTVCPVSCQSGHPLKGPDRIVCEKDDSFPPVASWKWNETSGITPWCIVKPCSDLTAPAHGALACDKWMHGRMCQMQCQSNYNFPVTAPADGMFVCGTATGHWRPKSVVPDCVAYAGFSTMRMKAYFYYNGSCPENPGVQQQIKQNFIIAVKNSLYGYESCTNVKACKADNVQVICGKTTRDLHQRGTTDSVTIKFDVVVPYDESKVSGQAALGFNDQRLHKVADTLTTLAQNGSLNLEKFGLKVDKATVEPQSASLDCPEGRMADMSKGSCVGCTKGSYLDSIQKSCVACPVGTYQEEDARATCTKCPEGQSTATIGSHSGGDCRGICAPGLVSPDGLEPCSPCPMGSFQGMPRNEHCSACPEGMITTRSGSTSFEDCLDFDITLTVNSVAGFKPTTKDLSKLTYAVWLYFYREVEDSFSIVKWQDPVTEKPSLEVDVSRTNMEIKAGGRSARAGITIPAGKWTHFAIQADVNTGNVSLFMNGYLAAFQYMQMTGSLITKGHRLVIRPLGSVVVLSRLVVFDDVVPNQTIARLAESCVTSDSPHLMDLTDIDMEYSDGPQFTIPSVCREFLQ